MAKSQSCVSRSRNEHFWRAKLPEYQAEIVLPLGSAPWRYKVRASGWDLNGSEGQISGVYAMRIAQKGHFQGPSAF